MPRPDARKAGPDILRRSVPAAGLFRVRFGSAPLRSGPGPEWPLQTELLRGERFRIAAQVDDWVLGTALRDGYEGYVPAGTLALALGVPATHRVSRRATLLYREPDATAETAGIAWLGSLLTAYGTASERNFFKTGQDLWVPGCHLAPVGCAEPDPAGVAERLVGVPYCYGGRTGAGMDCSALVQLALQAAGVDAPRDSGPQQRTLGTPVPESETRKRNDLAFWDGHVGILLGPDTLLHANAFHMAVAIEPFEEARKRLEDKRVAWRGIRRIDAIRARSGG